MNRNKKSNKTNKANPQIIKNWQVQKARAKLFRQL